MGQLILQNYKKLPISAKNRTIFSKNKFFVTFPDLG
jgi:hypothetical protein